MRKICACCTRQTCGNNRALPRAILKPVYRLGVPNSDPQLPKSVDFWCKLLSPFVVAESQGKCFEIFSMQNSQKFSGVYLWTTLGTTLN